MERKDGSGEEIASGNAQIGDGQSETWEYVVIDVMPETYTLSISRDQGNDSLDIQNDIHITYDAAESPSSASMKSNLNELKMN